MERTSLIEIQKSVPPEVEQDLFSIIREINSTNEVTTIVLDDDPTGTQTVHDVPVLTRWSLSLIKNELNNKKPLFFILTNSRSLQEEEAIRISIEIGRLIHQAAIEVNRKVRVISRSDSTLRGHYPAEVTALKGALQLNNATEVLIPAFFQGGRYTINDIHYVEEYGDLIPAAQTPFASDKTFGYHASNLKDWVIEKTGHALQRDEVASISIPDIRTKDTEFILEKLTTDRCRVMIINALSQKDLEVVSIALLKAEQAGRPFLYRTAASIIPVITGQAPKDLLGKDDFKLDKKRGGLIIIGSYVPKTTAQLNFLLNNNDLESIEMPVSELLLNENSGTAYLKISSEISECLMKGRHVVLYTSREQVIGENKTENLIIVNRVANAVNSIVNGISIRPQFVITKGGITSCDIAAKCFGVKRALVLGQILPGVPVWRLDGKWDGLTYVVFPGNVGTDSSLSDAFQKLAR